VRTQNKGRFLSIFAKIIVLISPPFSSELNLIFMQKLFKIAIFSFIFAHIACKSDPVNCVDEKVGDIFFTQKTADFLPLTGNEKLVFKDSAGVEMRFQCKQPAVGRFNCNVEKLCEDLNLAARFKFLASDTKTLNFETASSIAPVSFNLTTTLNNAILRTENDVALFENFSCTFFNGTTGGSLIAKILDPLGSKTADIEPLLLAQSFRNIADTTILGKNLTNLLEGKPFSGTPPTSKTTVFYQKNKGVAAFTLADGRVFVFDRIE
jgi:hypothetical protein